MSLPLVYLAGTAYEQGLQHGQALSDLIRHNLALYFDRFEREAKLSRDEVIRRGARYLGAIVTDCPEYAEAMRGVADGVGCSVEAIAALNVRYELLYYELGRIAMIDGCTAFALTPAAVASGHLYLGQNWDWIPGVRCAVVRTSEADGLETLAITEAGIVGAKIGLNSVGLGLAINGLTTVDDDWSRLNKPFHVRCYEILRARDLDSAVGAITRTPRSCSSNFLIAQIPDQVVDVEAAPDRAQILHAEAGCLVHANHFERPADLGIVETPSELGPDSCQRRDRLGRLLDAARPCAVIDVMQFLRDHDGFPSSVCRHEDTVDPPEERYATVVSAIIDLHDRTLYVADGQPCRVPYERLSLERG